MVLRWIGILVASVFWVVAGAAALVAMMIVFTLVGLVFGPAAVLGSPFVALLLLLMGGKVARRVRVHRANMVLQYIEQALRLNLPLSPALEAARLSERGGTARRLRDVQGQIEQGATVGEAVQSALPELSSRVTSLVVAADRLGRLPATLTEIMQRQRRAIADQAPDNVFSWAYALVLVIAVAWFAGGAYVFIGPQFVEIFEDFEAELPWMTRLTLGWAEAVGPVLMALAGLAVFAAGGWALRSLLRRPDRRPLPGSGVVDRVLWCVPLVHGVLRDRGMADACGLMAQAVQAGHRVEQAVGEVGELRLNAVLAGRFARLGDALDEGQSLGQAARVARLPALMVELLGTAEQTGNPQRVLDFLHRYYRLRFSRVVELARAGVLPIVIFAMALIVGWIVLSLYLPILTLLQNETMHLDNWM